MISKALQDDVAGRVLLTRVLRSGNHNTFIRPPDDWPRIVHEAWPTIWSRPPCGVAIGLIDVIMAMSQHISEIDPEAKMVDAFTDYLSGGLLLRASFQIEAVREVVNCYEYLARNLCSQCGLPGEVRDIVAGFNRVREIRCRQHQEGTQ